MARFAKHPCRANHCGVLLDKPGYCELHHIEHTVLDKRKSYQVQKLAVTEDYKERNRFYQRSAWKKIRAAQLRIEPLCRACREQGKLIEAGIVDHIIPISDGGEALDLSNLQSLCKPHHDAKTRREGRLTQNL